MKQRQEIKLFNSKKSQQVNDLDQENQDPNIQQQKSMKSQQGSTIKKQHHFQQQQQTFSASGRNPWSNSNTGEHCSTTAHDDVETSCFNLGPQKVSQLPYAQQLSSQHQLDSYIQQRNVQDALIFMEEFDDIDWVKSGQIVQILDIINKGQNDLISNHTINLVKLLNSKQYLLSKLLVKGLYNNAFRVRPNFGDVVDQVLQDIMQQEGEFQQHQCNYASLSLYSYAYHLLQCEWVQNCWNLVRERLNSMDKGIGSSEDMEKTIQKICELLLRYCIEKSNINNDEMFNQILDVGVRALQSRPNDIFFNKLIDFSFKNKQVVLAERLFRFMTQDLCINPTIVTINTLIDQYFKNHQQEKAWEVFNTLKTTYVQISADNFTYTTLINGLKSGRDGIMDLRKAFELFEEYKLNSQPDQIIYNCLLDACINAGDLNKAYQLLHEMKQIESITLDEITYNTLIKGCGRKKRLNDAINLFEEMKTMNINPNRISFNSLLDSCVKCNRMNIAWKYYEEMTKQFRIVPDNFTYSILVNGIKTNHSNRDELLKAILLLEEIQEDGSFKADEILYNSLIDACVKFNDIQKSLQLFNEMKRKGIEPSSVTYGILIKAYGKQNDLTRAFKIFDEMKQNGVPVNDVTYGCLVDACVKNDRLDMALELTDLMKLNGVPLNTVLFTTLIKGFARSGRIDDALQTFATMKKNTRTLPNLITYNSLLDGLIKHQKINEAELLFNEMLQSDNTLPDLISFSTLLKGHCRYNDIKKLKEIVEHMVRLGVQPDESLLLLVIDACLSQQHYAIGLSVFDQFCQHIPSSIPLLFASIRLYTYCNRLDNAKQLLIKLLQSLDDNNQQRHINRACLEKLVALICINASNAPELISYISEIAIKSHRKFQIITQDVSQLIVSSNEHMLQELLTISNLTNEQLLLLQQNLTPQGQKIITQFLTSNIEHKTEKNFGEKFGNIVKNCAQQNNQNELVLREITKSSQQRISINQNQEKQGQINPDKQKNSFNYHDENKNYSNTQYKPYQNHSKQNQQYDRKPKPNQNDLDDFISKKSQWRPVKKY